MSLLRDGMSGLVELEVLNPMQMKSALLDWSRQLDRDRTHLELCSSETFQLVLPLFEPLHNPIQDTPSTCDKRFPILRVRKGDEEERDVVLPGQTTVRG